MEQESFSSRPHPYWSSSSSQPPPPPPPTINILSLPEDLIDPPPPLLCFEQTLLQPNLNPSENDPLLHLPFPMIPSDPSLALDSNFLDVFGHEDSGGGGCDPFLLERWCCQNGGVKMEKTVTTPDSFMDDFPMDMFDHIEPLPSPSDW